MTNIEKSILIKFNTFLKNIAHIWKKDLNNRDVREHIEAECVSYLAAILDIEDVLKEKLLSIENLKYIHSKLNCFIRYEGSKQNNKDIII